MDKYFICIKNYKILLTVEYICPGKIILLRSINDNILISHPSYSGVVVVVDIFHQSVRLVQIMRWWVSNLRH